MRIGLGYDVHQLVPDRKLWLGGIEIPHTLGLLGHSDADVLLHAICDALLGAAALGDIGKHFPDNDPKYKNIDSKLLLRRCNELLLENGYRVGNIDSIIVAQKPKVGPYIPQMRECIASILGIEPGQVSVKATTTEHLGFEGREEGISAHAIALLLPA
ncbi:MAG: 2-C-methyl-D-erythritol 2,4-cyclodiphosphate synthase [Bacteroidales bacterium]|jgi:2-C-methyl-D-erythritol 2,4-cyclodiphosphate synthase|nr:2-C-methyl-D-erythritol 2,4-cyclodiphosphate synthase [Bacteroidales bacterium]MBR5354388.1 2-C-methyl-D-erythritol 2,4-cyclodiphosphate synthase [Bacteroidales bacterium]